MFNCGFLFPPATKLMHVVQFLHEIWLVLVMQLQEAAMMEPPSENAMPIVMVDSEAQPSETVLAVEQTGEVIPMIMDPPALRAGPPHPASTGTGRTRRPCHGWISDSESDSDYEEYLARRQKQVHVPAK